MMNKQAFVFSGLFIVIILAVVSLYHFSDSLADMANNVAVTVMNAFR